MKVAYLLDAFPVTSETFIVREILELRRIGISVFICAEHKRLGANSGNVLHADAQSLLDEVYFFSSAKQDTPKSRLLLHHLQCLVSRPSSYLQALLLALRSKKGRHAFAWAALHCREFTKQRVNHIHAHFALSGCTYAMFVSMLTGIPFSFTIHAYDIFVPGLADLLGEKLQHAKFIAAISEYNKHYMLEHHPRVDGDKFKIVHCGIDPTRINPSAYREEKTARILATGRLVEKKGFRYLIEACHLLRDRLGPHFLCNIIGEGKERDDLAELITAHNLGELIRLRGAQKQSVVLDELRRASLFVLPCVIEQNGNKDGIPVALMEAMAMGIPVVSTTVSGIPELIGPGGGVLVAPRDSVALADALTSLLNLSPEERAQIGQKGRRTIEQHFNIVTEVGKLARYFQA